MRNERMMSPEKLLRIIKKNLVKVVNVEEIYNDVMEMIEVDPEKFIQNLENYVESGIFSNAIDFYYKTTKEDTLIVTCDNISTACKCSLWVELHLADGVSIEDVEAELRQNIFDQIMQSTKKNEHELIHPYEAYVEEEVVFEDFITRREFINRTGIYVSPMYFELIYDCFKESGVTVDEFINDFEDKYVGDVVELPINCTFKYLISDDDVSGIGLYEDMRNPTIWEIVDLLARAYHHKWVSLDNTMEILERLQGELQTELLKCNESSKIAS